MIVFIGGSRSIRSLPREVQVRIDAAVLNSSGIVIGDASGVDAEVQRYLKSRGTGNVTVYCAKGGPRNNIGAWPVVEVESKARPKTFEFFAAKDRAMAAVADAGLVIWDGESQGTLAQSCRLAREGKFVTVFMATLGVFKDLRSRDDWTKFLDSLPVSVQQELELRIRKEAGSPHRELFEAAS